MIRKEDFSMYTSKRGLLVIPLVGLFLALLFYLISPGAFQDQALGMFLQGLTSTCIIWIGCMTIVQHLWKKYPWEHQPRKHLLCEIVSILLYLTILFLITLMLTEGFDLHAWKREYYQHGINLLNTTFITFLITAIHEAYYFYRQWKANFSKSAQLEKENIQAQYNSLKAQVNPHFLFNSLNSLASLVEDNPKAERFVQDLSDFMRFALTSSERETVTLKEEMEHLDKYLWLMNVRLGENLTVTRKIKPEALKLSLPPLVLQILVENCIKHNVVTHAKPLHIHLEADLKKITVSNNLQKKTAYRSTGLGLANIRGRYRYFTEENVKITESVDMFAVSVPLLASSTEE